MRSHSRHTGTRSDRSEIAREEAALARRAAAGDRQAFDLLFDRYYARLARRFRHLPRDHARAAIRERLEQIFAGLDSGQDVSERAFRIARH